MPGSETIEARLRRARRSPLFAVADVPAVDLGRAAIEQVIPHRGSMLLLDRITHLDPRERKAVGIRRIDPNDPVFEGHFPGDPLYPGVLQVEMGGQLGLFLAGQSADAQSSGKRLGTRLIRVREAVFVAEVRPGAVLTALAQVEEDDGYVLSCLMQLLQGDTIICVAAFEAMLSELDA